MCKDLHQKWATGLQKCHFWNQKGSQSFEEDCDWKKKKKPGKIWVGPDYYQDVQESWEKPPSNRKFKQINNIWLTESFGHL